VKPIKMLGLAALAALMAMTFVAASSAMAGSTSLCKVHNENPCASGNRISHVHEANSIGFWNFYTSIGNVFCAPLFLGDVKSANNLGAPLIISGTSSFSGCTSSFGNCSVTEENGPSEIKVLRTGHETATVTYQFLVHIVCSPWLNCRYTGVGLTATANGPLLSSGENGELSISGQELIKESGALCPASGELEVIMEPLSATYIST
jgi:hypothetical protein